MGVLGLAPFLLKACPDVIKTLPDRLKTLHGKKVVIDGTLLTQRLHFAPLPHRYRHVLGWYRIVKELQESEVQAICVFDGRERSVAKQIEVERRRKVRRVTAFRGMFEAERFDRLRRLERLSNDWITLDLATRDEVLATVHTLLTDRERASAWQRAHADMVSDDSVWRTQLEAADFRSMYAGVLVSSSENLDISPSSRTFEDVSPREQNEVCYPDEYADEGSRNNLPPLDQLAPDDRDLFLLDHLIDQLAAREQSIYDGPGSKELFTKTLITQYLQYQRSIHRLQSLPQIRSTSIPADDVVDSRDDDVMSKNQHLLTIEEGRFWEDLANSSTSEEAQTVMRSMIVSLAHKSHLLSQSYERRTNPPTVQTYEESKEILRAMGVPCIETSGPFEAEALASSLVLSGCADYVASEDSDVIVYEAPLIRNLTSRKEPLVIISGADVRSGLQLDRASFVDFALLLGTDFSQRIKNVGPQRALNFIREYGSIERVLENERRFPPRIPQESYLSQVTRARIVFETLPPLPDLSTLEPMPINEEAVTTILGRYNLQREISSEWDYSGALAGNYFQDNPSAS